MFQKDHSCTEWNGLEEIKTRGDTEGSRATETETQMER